MFTNLVQVLSALFYTYYIFERFCVPQFKNIGNGAGSVKTVLESVFMSMLPAFLVLLLAFFAILHSWLNAWAGLIDLIDFSECNGLTSFMAELLRFADRQFYKDWYVS